MSARRGQGTVELALGSLVFITVVLFGIHFAEVGVVKLRTQQAATGALWDTTARRLHHLTDPNRAGRFLTSDDLPGAKNPATRAQAQFRDFDRLASVPGSMQLALTRASNLKVDCTPARVAIISGGPVEMPSGLDYARSGGQKVDGMRCGASATVALIRAGKFAEDSNGFFQKAQVWRPTLTVCAFGRASGGQCVGTVPIALDDWGLSGSDASEGDETNECDQFCLYGTTAGNQAYRDVVKRIYEDYLNNRTLGGANIDQFVRVLFTQSPPMPSLMNVPVDERDLRFNFIGEDGMPPQKPGAYTATKFGFATREQDKDSVGVYNSTWASTPYSSKYKAAYDDRGGCFLGNDCSRSSFNKRSW